MIKSLFFLFALTILGISTKAQYSNTSWKGMYKVPEPTEMILEFKTDTLFLDDPANGTIVEMMKYNISGDTLTLVKISGASSCGDEKGVYKLSIKDNKLYMAVINDDCYDRAAAMPDEPLEKAD